MNLSKTTQYALRILSLMVTYPKKIYSSDYLYNILEIPKKYLQRLLTDLSKNGFIKSIQGRNGGFVLAKEGENIYISDIIETVEGFQKEPSCFFGFESCALDDPCSMHDVWAESQENLIKVLSRTKLMDLKLKTNNI